MVKIIPIKSTILGGSNFNITTLEWNDLPTCHAQRGPGHHRVHVGPRCHNQSLGETYHSWDQLRVTAQPNSLEIHSPGKNMKKSEVSAFQWFQEFQVFRVIWQCDTVKWGHPKPWESENVSSPSFGDLRIFAGVLRKFAGFLQVISNVFSCNFHFAQLNPQTLKNILDIQLPFQKQGALGVSGVWRQSPSFSVKSR